MCGKLTIIKFDNYTILYGACEKAQQKNHRASWDISGMPPRGYLSNAWTWLSNEDVWVTTNHSRGAILAHSTKSPYIDMSNFYITLPEDVEQVCVTEPLTQTGRRVLMRST